MQRAGIDFETAWEGTKFTAGVLGVVESSKEVFNSVWQNKNAVANSKLITLGRVIGVIGILDHSPAGASLRLVPFLKQFLNFVKFETLPL